MFFGGNFLFRFFSDFLRRPETVFYFGFFYFFLASLGQTHQLYNISVLIKVVVGMAGTLWLFHSIRQDQQVYSNSKFLALYKILLLTSLSVLVVYSVFLSGNVLSSLLHLFLFLVAFGSIGFFVHTPMSFSPATRALGREHDISRMLAPLLSSVSLVFLFGDVSGPMTNRLVLPNLSPNSVAIYSFSLLLFSLGLLLYSKTSGGAKLVLALVVALACFSLYRLGSRSSSLALFLLSAHLLTHNGSLNRTKVFEVCFGVSLIMLGIAVMSSRLETPVGTPYIHMAYGGIENFLADQLTGRLQMTVSPVAGTCSLRENWALGCGLGRATNSTFNGATIFPDLFSPLPNGDNVIRQIFVNGGALLGIVSLATLVWIWKGLRSWLAPSLIIAFGSGQPFTEATISALSLAVSSTCYLVLVSGRLRS